MIDKVISDNAEHNSDADYELGKRIREIRQSRNLTIRALASQSGLSSNALSMIENGKTSPSVSTIQQIASALRVPIGEFFQVPKVEKRVVHVRSSQRPKVHVNSTSLENLGEDLADNAVEPLIVTLNTDSGSGGNRIVHTGHEFVYCLSGKVLYTIEHEHYLLEPGDSIVFEAHLPHEWQNVDAGESKFILVLIPSTSKDNPAESHLFE